jgi:hypothetical protein
LPAKSDNSGSGSGRGIFVDRCCLDETVTIRSHPRLLSREPVVTLEPRFWVRCAEGSQFTLGEIGREPGIAQDLGQIGVAEPGFGVDLGSDPAEFVVARVERR